MSKKKTNTSKTKTVKNEPKKVEVKEEIKEEIVPEKVEKKCETRTILTNKTIAILYGVCAIIWFVSSILDYIASEIVRGTINLVVAIMLGILSFI